MDKEKTIIQAIYYLVKAKGSLDKRSALKLLFFADRYHLRRYGRMITKDTYYAMRNGAVPSLAKDLLKAGNIEIEKVVTDYRDKFLILLREYDIEAVEEVKPDDLDHLSKSDIEALEFSLNNFGRFDSDRLWELTHIYPEWKRFERRFLEDRNGREKILVDDFFEDSLIEDDPFNTIPKDIVQINKEFYNGFF
ncbi:MAG: SocA family protein [Helicobacteraceae bacterium]|jgi:hypothetical protein|nr:SocA family protein [Helicobacteraceae bacterium]